MHRRRCSVDTVTNATLTSTQIGSELVALTGIVVTPFHQDLKYHRNRVQTTVAASCTVTFGDFLT